MRRRMMRNKKENKKEVTIQQLRQNPGRVVRRVAEGETLVIVAGRTRIPVAWLMPYRLMSHQGKETTEGLEEDEGEEG